MEDNKRQRLLDSIMSDLEDLFQDDRVTLEDINRVEAALEIVADKLGLII